MLFLARLAYVQFVPPRAYTPDEAAILLNAQLLSETGKDEWNQPWPVVYRSFGDSKLPGYLYSVWLTGNLWKFEWLAVRIPSILAGALLPLAVWCLVRNLVGSARAAWMTVLFLIISPWTWHYGTIGFEANLALLLFIAALALLYKKTAAWWSDLLASLFLIASVLTYNAPLFLLPAVLVGVIAWRWPNGAQSARAAFGVIVAGVAAGAVTLAATSQKVAISIFQDPTLQALYPEYRAQFPGVFQTILGNQWVYFLYHSVTRWVDSWTWEFLVSRGGANPWHGIPGTGHLNGFVLISLAIFVPYLVFTLWKTRSVRSHEVRALGILIWLTGTALVPAIVTVDAPHATRSLFFFVALSVLAAWSLSEIWNLVQKEFPQWGRHVFVGTVVLICFWQTIMWVSPAQVRWQYFVSPRWNANLIQALQKEEIQTAQTVIVIDPNGTLAAYIGVYDAQARTHFSTDVVRTEPDTVGLVRVERLGKYLFFPQIQDIPEYTQGVILQSRSNTEWDIIKP